MSPEDWSILRTWIDETTSTVVQTPSRVKGYQALAHQVCRHYFDSHPDLPRSQYQCDALGILFVVSCFSATVPACIPLLRDISADTFSAQSILSSIRMVIRWMCPCHQQQQHQHVRTLYTCSDSQCDLVRTKDHRYLVRKEIKHQSGVPVYHGVVEVMAQYLLRTSSPPCANIVRLEGVYIDHRTLMLFYEYLEHPLDRHHSDRDVLGMLRGIQTLHDRSICHRDIKPDNLRYDPSRGVVVIDLGAAGFGTQRDTIPICTITHRPPEILSAEVDSRNCTYDGFTLDIWSIGVLLVDMYVRKEPFGTVPGDMTALEMLSRITTRLPRILRQVDEVLEPPLAGLIRRSLGPARDRPSIAEFVTFFEGRLKASE